MAVDVSSVFHKTPLDQTCSNTDPLSHISRHNFRIYGARKIVRNTLSGKNTKNRDNADDEILGLESEKSS